MKIDKEKLSSMAALSDEELWRTVTEVAAKNGINMPVACPSHEELLRLRAAMTSPDRLNALGALKLINKYKRG